MIIQFAWEKAGLVIVFIRVPLYLASSTISLIRDGMKSFSNRRWADRNVWFNVPRGTRECCNTHGWPKVQKVRE
jgi:hypothetical protein